MKCTLCCFLQQLVDFTCFYRFFHRHAQVNCQKAAQGAFHGIVDYTELPLVSTDFNHDPHSAIVDGTQTRVSGAHLIKTLVWCDNEWGFANRMLDTTLAMAAIGFRFDA